MNNGNELGAAEREIPRLQGRPHREGNAMEAVSQKGIKSTIFTALIGLALGLVAAGGCNKAAGAGGDGGTDTDADADTDADTDSDTDTDTDIPENPCPDGQHAECYAEDVWCFDADDVPQALFDDCSGGEACVQLSDEVAVCQCTSDAYRECYGGDVWSFDSCDEMESMVVDCVDPSVCTDLGDALGADCCEASPSLEQCSEAGDVNAFLSCETLGAVDTGTIVVDCNANQDCADLTTDSAECQCRNHWMGEDCLECEPHWDAEADCNECAGYWTGAECDVCEGVGTDADHCQCPESADAEHKFTPDPSGDWCWTCPGGTFNGMDGYPGCGGTLGAQDVLWADAAGVCPDGFTLPTQDDFRKLMDDCEALDDFDCDTCSGSMTNGCNVVFGSDAGSTQVWTVDECGPEGEEDSAHYKFSLITGDIDVPGWCSDAYQYAHVTCVHK